MKSTIHLMRFLKKSRLRKKQKLYKLAFGVAFDLTITIYTGLFAIMFLFIAYDSLKQLEAVFLEYQANIESFFPLIVIGLIFGMIALSFQHPSINITSAEWKLTSLPFSIRNIWLYSLWIVIKKRFVVLSLLIMLLVLITPFSSLFLIKWYGVILSVFLLTVIPQWYFFQIQGFKKIGVYLLGVLSIGVIRLAFVLFELNAESVWILIILLFGLNVWIWPRRLKKINWMQVIEKSDSKEWNMFFINHMSRMDQVKQQRRNYFLQTLFTSKKAKLPFPYQQPAKLMRKLWRRSINQEVHIIYMMMFSILAIMIVLSLREGPLLQGIAIMLSVFIFVKLTVSFFSEIFKDKLFHSIPWNMKVITTAFWQIVSILSIMIMVIISVAVLLANTWSWWLVAQLLFIVVALFFLLDCEIERKVKALDKKRFQPAYFDQVIGILTYVGMAVSLLYPFTISYLTIILLYWIAKKHYFPLKID
ncbi:hypothetical protein SAMN04487943_11291 [Gracilibacillus orientalis]|uniref:Uncharacterized protein n=1 Tax=Gracilibacillus orientalis TaxID=334253 RepID=A0A1I4PPN4_9BACI|nr:hypothetical protein [Gracilibacillus orientalis]SFM29689.1 hypothetical protein SAMN04487943_11291 [Gracilibacillus orientalis]